MSTYTAEDLAAAAEVLGIMQRARMESAPKWLPPLSVPFELPSKYFIGRYCYLNEPETILVGECVVRDDGKIYWVGGSNPVDLLGWMPLPDSRP